MRKLFIVSMREYYLSGDVARHRAWVVKAGSKKEAKEKCIQSGKFSSFDSKKVTVRSCDMVDGISETIEYRN